MVNREYTYLASLPGTQEEQTWLRDRLETLSVWESTALAALTQCPPPSAAEEMVNHVLALQGCSIYFAPGDYEDLGKQALRRMGGKDPDELLPHVDLHALGMRFEDLHPGLFVENWFVAYPSGKTPVYRGRDSPLPEDDGWSVKLKLASPAAPEGVWLRLPDYPSTEPGDASVGEIALAKDALQVQSLDECTLLEAKCILPEAGNLQEQYDSIEALVFDGNNLGFILDERGQGAENWLDRFAAALEYEGCHTLRFALDISQNLDCYEWVPCDGLEDFAARHLRSCGVSEDLIRSGCINLEGYAEDLLETSGYMLTSDESAYVTRNLRKFEFGFCAAEETATARYDFLKSTPDSIPLLVRLSDKISPEEVSAAKTAIREALAERGPNGLRQLQAAMEFEECDGLKEAVEIAVHLDSYGFVDIRSFRETTKEELLSKGVDEKALRCFDYETYAALTHDFAFIHTSSAAGMYLCKTDPSFQLPKWQEQTGMQGSAM